MKRFVYNPKYAKLLVSMAGETSQIDELARRISANAGHLRIVLEQWHKEDIITKDKPGRDYQIKLTVKGEAISTKLAELMDLDERWKEPKLEPEAPKDQEIKTEVAPVHIGLGTLGNAPLESTINPKLDKPKGKGEKTK